MVECACVGEETTACIFVLMGRTLGFACFCACKQNGFILGRFLNYGVEEDWIVYIIYALLLPYCSFCRIILFHFNRFCSKNICYHNYCCCWETFRRGEEEGK